MLSEELPGQIERLVDNLRKNGESHLSLTDVASITEVLIGTMTAYFSSIDTSIYKECQALTDYISNARSEIAALSSDKDEEEDVGTTRAGMELDAIVQATEEATNTIMTAAEEIMVADPTSEEDQTQVQNAVMQIFEACSFQDITGQRISKVVETLTHIEGRVNELSNLLGVSKADILRAKSEVPQKEYETALLSGPALEGEGIGQSDVDDLMATKDLDPTGGGDETAVDDMAATEVPQDTGSDKSILGVKKKAGPSALLDDPNILDPGPIATPDAAPEKEEEKSETTSQEDIDALFN